jgi:hypothetical protein
MNEDCPCIDGGWRLRFDPVLEGARPIDFPCDRDGYVDLDALDEEQRQTYFSARILRGLHHPPRVIRANDH